MRIQWRELRKQFALSWFSVEMVPLRRKYLR
jgi:hypothetical protein